MAALQMFARVGSPMVPLQSCLSPPCCLRVGSSDGATSSATTTTRKTLSEQQSVCSLAAASNNDMPCTSGRTARYTGAIYRSATATERGVPRAASLLGMGSPVETELTGRPMESAHWSTFEAEVEAGRLECGRGGCRPIFDDVHEEGGCATRVAEVVDEDWGNDEAFSLLEARAATYTERRAMRDLEIRPYVGFPLDFAEFVNDVWQERSIAARYFDIAMRRNPNDAMMLVRYAQFVWKTLGDLDKADELFARAVEESHDDADVQAMYALFVWQTDE